MGDFVNIWVSEIENLHGMITETFKRRLQKLLEVIPEEPKINNYIICVVTDNSIIKQI